MQKNIAISDRIAGQFPAFIRQDYPTFVEFVRGYYESQERSGYPIDILNNITKYFDVDTYRNAKITSCTNLTTNVLKGDTTIQVETTEGFKDTDGMILIDSEVITYAERTESPKAIFTTGISGIEVDRKQIELDSLFFQFDGVQRLFDLKYLGAPAFIVDVNHLIIEIYGQLLEPGLDFVVLNNNQIQFTNAPRARLPLDDQNRTSIKFLRGFVGDPISKLDRISDDDLRETLPSGKKVYRIQKGGVSYSPLHEELIYLVNNGIRLRPFIDYAVVDNNFILSSAVDLNFANNFIVSIEFAMPEFGTGAEAITTIDDTGRLTAIPIKSGGSDYTHYNPPKVTFKSTNGRFAAASTFVSGLTSITIVDGGSGYDPANPPNVTVGAPEDAFGTTATVVAVVNAAGSVTRINITNSGSGYTRQPKITIDRPPAATATAGTIVSGQLTDIIVTDGGRGYIDPPSVFISDSRVDAAGNQIGGSRGSASSILFANAVTDILISNFGQNYDPANPPIITISAPKGATASATIGVGEITGFEIFDSGTSYNKSAFNRCSRAFSGLAGLDSTGDINFKTSLQSDHRSGTEVKNLQVLFIKKFLDEVVKQFIPTLPSSFFNKVDPALLIKNIRDFYVSKGTAKSIQFLFRMLYGESVNISYPREQLLTPSASQWKIDTLLRVRVVSGDPTKLSGQVLQQFADTSDTNIQYASALVQEVISLQIADENIFEIYIDADSQVGSFVVPYKTILSENIGPDNRIISVDSTIGWPERNGFFFINNYERVSYKEKTLTQFIDCERYYEQPNLTQVSLQAGTPVSANITIQATDINGNPVVMSILGIAEASKTEITDTKSYYLPGDKLQVANLGTTSDKTLVRSWLYNVKKLLRISSISVTEDNGVYTATVTTENNNHGILTGDSITIYGATPAIYNGVYEVTNIITTGTGIVNQFTYTLNGSVTSDANGTMFVAVNLNKGKSTNLTVNNNVNDFIANVQNTYINNDYCYVSSSGIPNYNIGPFVGTSLVPGNQRHLKRFPFVTQPTSSKTETVAGSTGQWVNGVSLYNYKSSEGVTFGSLTKINVVTAGTGYDAQNKPNLIITGGGGTGARGEVVVNGSLTEIILTNGGSGYTTVPIVSIAGGGGEGATATAVISNGAVTKILIENGGTGYTSAPQISLVGGGGGGATATASVRGPVKEVVITNGGIGYTTQPTVRLNSGVGAAAQPVVINGKIESIALLSSGSGYTSPPTVFISGDGFGAEATAQLGEPGTIEADRVVSVTLSNKGIDYTQQNTTVFLLSIGEGAQFNVEIFKWEFNNGEVWQQQTIPNVGQFIFQKSNYARRLDAANGYVFTSQNSQFGGEYAHLSNPIFLRYNLSDNLVKTTANNVDTYTESGANKTHSPILGWAYDGNPIYGPYGFQDPNTISSDAVRMTSSYRLKTTRDNGPDIFPKVTVTVTNFGVNFIVGGFVSNQSAPTAPEFGGSFPVLEVLSWNSVTGVLELKPYGNYTNLPVVGNTLVQSAPAQSATVTSVGEHYVLGSFIQDYEYVFNLGTLDEYNGRFCKTPEFPNGVYAYFVTIGASADGHPTFPYVIGDRYQAVPNDWNFSNSSNQAYLPLDITRYRDAYLNTDVDDIERTPNKEASELILENGDGSFGQDGETLALAPEDTDNSGYVDTVITMTSVTSNFVAGQTIQSTGQQIKTANVVSWDAANAILRVEYAASTPDVEKFVVNEILLQVSSGATGVVEGITTSESETFITLLEEPELEVFDYFPSVSIESRVDIEVETINRFESARVTGFSIENPGTNYAVNDPLIFDDSGTEGAGVAAAVGSIAGLTISNYTFTLDGSNFKATVTTSGNNDLEIGDTAIINNPANNLTTTKTFFTKVIEGIQSFTVTQSGTGYNSRITPSPKITVIGEGYDFIGTTTPTAGGELTSIDITNSGNGFDPLKPPVVKIEHPQKDAGSSYWYVKSSALEDHIKVTKLISSKNKDVYAIGEGENVFTGRTWTRTGDVDYTVTNYKFGGSALELDQTSNPTYISASTDTDISLATGEFTIEAFVRGTWGTSDKVLFGKWGATSSEQSYIVYVDSTGHLAAKINTQRAAVNTQTFTNAFVSSADQKFGSNSIKVSNTSNAVIETAASNAFAFGIRDFTVEGFFKFADLSGANTLFDFRTGGLDELPTLYVNTSGQLVYATAGSDLDTSTGTAITTGQWYHIALVRNGGTVKSYVDGVEYNSITHGTNFGISAIFHFGTNFDNADPVRDGYIDEVRVSYGARYTTTFTPPSAAFIPDLDTLALYHCEDSAGSVAVTDDILTTINLNTATDLLSDDTWHHVAIRRLSNEIKLFVDGIDSGGSPAVPAAPADAEYNNGALIAVNNGTVFDRALTVNGLKLVVAGAVGGQLAVPDEWAKKTARAFELMTDPNGAGINTTHQRNFIKTLRGDGGTYHAGIPTVQRVGYGGGSTYTPNWLQDVNVASYAGLQAFNDSVAQKDMVWYKNINGNNPPTQRRDIEEIFEHIFHTIHAFGIPGAVPGSIDAVEMNPDIRISVEPSFDWQNTAIHLAMKEVIDAGLYDPSGYAADWNTDPEKAAVAYTEYTYLVNWSMWDMSQYWDGGSLAPEWSDSLKTPAGMLANNPLGYALFNTYFAPVLSKPNFATIESIFGQNDTGVSGYVVDGIVSGSTSLVNFIYAGSASAPILPSSTDFTIGHTADTAFAKSTLLQVDGFRFSLTSRYDGASFTAPTTTFAPDSFTTSLLNFNGEVGDTAIEDRGKVEYYAVVMRYLPTGALRWKQFIKATPANSGFNSKINLKALALSQDESYLIVAGETNTSSTSTENPDIYVHRLDPEDGTVGSSGWQVNIAGSGGSGTNEEYVEDISIGADNKIYIVGRTTTNTVSTFDNFIVVMSDSGQVLNSRKVNTNTANDYFYGVHATSTNGEVVLVGKNASASAEALTFTKLQLDLENYPNIVSNKQHLKGTGTESFGKIRSDIDEDGNMYVLVEVLNAGIANQIQLLKIANESQSYNFGDIYWQKYLNATVNTTVSIADISIDVFREIHIAFNHISTQTGVSEAYIQKYDIFGTQVKSTKLDYDSQEDANYDSAIILGCTSDVSGDTIISGCVVRSKEIGTNYVTPFDTNSYRLSQESLLIFKFRKDHDFRVEPDQTTVSKKYPRKAQATASNHPNWNSATVFAAGSFAVYLGNIYRTTAGGTTGSNPPTHLTGDTSDGGVTWTFHSTKGQLIFSSKVYVVDDQANTVSAYVTSWDVNSQELVLNNVSGPMIGNPDFLYQIDVDNPSVYNAAFNLNTFINFATENNYNSQYTLTVNASNDFTTLADSIRNISNIANGAAGIQTFDISDAAASGLTLANDYITNPRSTNYSTRIATVPNENGQELKVTANVREKYYIEQANVVRTQRVIQLNLDGSATYTVGARLTQANTSATGLVAEVTSNRVLLYDVGTSAWQIGSGNSISSNVAGDTPSRYPVTFSETKYVFVRTALSHYLTPGQIINVEGYNESTWTGNFNVYSAPGIRDFLYEAEDAAVVLNSSTVPSVTNNFSFGGNINNVYVYSKAPVLNLIRGQRYQFDTSHPSNLPYYLNFSRDNLNKIEFDFRNIPLRQTSTITTAGTYVTIELTSDIEQIIYYYAQDYSGDNSLVEPISFVNIIDNPYSGTFTVTSKPTASSYTFNLTAEPDTEVAANIGSTKYSTTSRNVTGPISTIKLINSGGFYRKLPEVTGVITNRNITKILIDQIGQNYVDGTYSNLDIVGDGTGAKAQIKIISGELAGATVTDPGINYTFGTLSINTIPGIISQGGAGAEVTVFIPPIGNGATIFPTGTEIGKIKTIKNSNFGFDYPHDYTLRPEITFPVNLQLRDASALTDIKITNPGSGYTTVPEVIISGGGGSGATAVATVRNNRLDGIEVTNPGQGYSSPPAVSIASVFAYQVNLDDQLMQFSFPHGINTGDVIRLQGVALEGVAHVLPSPSSAGLVSLDSATNYFAVAGTVNGLDDDQLRIALTLQDAQTGAFITFANTGQGKQQVTTEAFAGAAEAIVDVVSFLPGEYVYQGDDPNSANASGYVSEIDGWQKGPRILRLTNPTGTFSSNQTVTGLVSRSSGTIDSINQSSGILNISSETQTAGEFADNIGLLNDSSQRIQDSYFYQNFSYVIKSEVEISEWRDTVKNSVHPGGFRVFGELTLREPSDIIVGSRFTTSVERKVEISDFVSTSVIPFFTNVEPVYEALANSSVLFRDKDLTSSEVILTSVSKKIVDFSDQFDGEKRSFTLQTGDPENAGDTLNITPPADSLLITINGLAQSPSTGTTSTAPPNSFEVSGSTITFAEPPAPPTKLQYRELTFDSTSKVIIYPKANLQWTAGANYNIGDYVYNDVYAYRVEASGTASGNVDGSSFTPTAANYEPISGIMTVTIGSHGLRPGDKVRLLDNSFTFRCASDNYQTTITHPRPGSDTLAAGNALTILQTTATTITFNVGNAGTGAYTHQFVSALPNSVIEVTNGAPTHITDEVIRPGLATNPFYKYIGTFGTTLEIGDEMIGTISGATGIIQEITSPYGAEDQLTITQVDGKFVSGEKLRIVDKFTVVAARFGDAANLLEANKEFIAAEAVARMHVQFPDFSVPGGDVNCIDDIVDVTEAVAFNLQYGGNSRVYDATEIYVGASSLNYLETEKEQSAYAYEQAKEIALQVVINAAVQVVGEHGLTQFTDNTITPDPNSQNPCANVRSAVDSLYEILITTLEAINPRTYFDSLKRTIPQSPAVEFAIVEEFNARIEIEGIVNQGVPNPYPAWLVGDTVQGVISGQTARVVGIISQTTNNANSIIAQTLEIVYTNTVTNDGFINREFDSNGAVSIQPEQVYNPATSLPNNIPIGGTSLYGNIVIQQKSLVQSGVTPGTLDTQGDFIIGERVLTSSNDEAFINTDKQYDLSMIFEFDRRNAAGNRAPIYIGKGATCVQDIYEREFNFANKTFANSYSPSGLNSGKGVITSDYTTSATARIVNIKDQFRFNLLTRTGQMHISVASQPWGSRWQPVTNQAQGPFTAYALAEGDVIASTDNAWQLLIDEMQVLDSEVSNQALIKYKLLRGPKSVDTAGGSGDDEYTLNFAELPTSWKMIREAKTDHAAWSSGNVIYRGMIRRYGNAFYEAVSFNSATVPATGNPYAVTGNSFQVTVLSNVIVSAFDGNVNWVPWNPTNNLYFDIVDHAEDEYRMNVIEQDLTRITVSSPIFTEPDIPLTLAFQEQYTLLINYGGQQTTARVVYWDPGRRELVVKNIGNEALLGTNAIISQNLPYGTNQTAVIQANLQSAEVRTDLNNSQVTPFFARRPQSKSDQYVLIQKEVSGAGSGNEGLLKIGVDDIGTTLTGQSGGTTGRIKNVAIAVDKLTNQNLDDIYLSEVLSTQTDPITGQTSFLPNIPSFYGVVFERISVPGQGNTIVDDLSQSVLRYRLNSVPTFQQYFTITNDTLTYKNEDIISVFHFNGLDQQTYTFDTSHDPVRSVTLNGNAKLLTALKKFGDSALYLDGTGDYMSVATTTSYGFATNDFTIDFWMYPQSIASGVKTLIDLRTSEPETRPALILDGATVKLYVNGSDVITATNPIQAANWYHVALVKSGIATKLFINGAQEGSTYTDNNNYGATNPLYVGANFSGANAYTGYIDELMISNYAKYVGAFTSPTSEHTDLVSDVNDLKLDTLNMLNINAVAEFDQSEIYTMDRLTYPSTYNPPAGITAGAVLKNAISGGTSGTIMRVDQQNRRIYLKTVSGGSGFTAGNSIYNASNVVEFVLESYVQRSFNASQIANKRLLTMLAGGSGAAATFNVDPVSGALSINTLSGGQNFASAPQVTIESPPPGGTQALATATVSNGVVTAINLLDPGSGYTSPPNVTILGGPGVGTFKVGDEVTGLTSGVVADVISWVADSRQLEVIVVGPEDFASNEFIQGPAQVAPAVQAYFNLDTYELLETTLIAKNIPTFDSGDILYGTVTTTDGEIQSYQQNTANIISSNVKITYSNVTPTGNIFTVNTVIQVIENGNVIGQGTVQSFDADRGFFLMNNITGYFKVGDQIDAQVIPLGGGGAVAVTADITEVENFLDLNQVNGTGIAEKYEVYDNASNWSSKVKILRRKSSIISEVSNATKMLLDTETITGETDFASGDTITSVYTQDNVKTFNGSINGGQTGVGGISTIYNHLFVPDHGLSVGDKITYTSAFSSEVLILNNTTTATFLAGQNIFSDFGGIATVVNVDSSGRVLFIRDRQGSFAPGLTVTQGVNSETINQFITSPAIGGLVEEQEYYVIPGSLNTGIADQNNYISLATTLSNAQTGVRINITGTGYGSVHYLTKTNTIVADGQVTSFVKGFDGVKTEFPITAANGQTYAPPAEGHVLVFLNGVLQSPGDSYTIFGTNITFTEPPTVDSQFFAYYIGRLRKLDDIGTEFDSLRSSFNLLLNGNPYSLSLSDGVQNQVVKAENNLIITLNGILQEPGIAFNLLGSRIDFSEAPKTDSKFLAFSFVGSDADVEASEIIPPIEVGDELRIQGEIENREVAVVGSSNELTTFDYQGTIEGVGAQLTPILSSGYIESIRVTNGGTGYTSNPNVAILSNTGTGAQAVSLVGINQVQVTGNGIGYKVPAITLTGGSQLTATRSAVLVPQFNKRGGIESVTVTDAGAGYDPTNPPQINIINAGSPIKRPNLEPQFQDGRLVSVRVFETGAGFDHARVDIIGDYNPNTFTGSGGTIASTGFDPTRIFRMTGSNAEAFLTSAVMYVYSDGLPFPATAGTFPNPNNPNTISAQNITHEFVWRGGTGSRGNAGPRNVPLGIIGVMANGVALFNPSAGVGGNPPAGFNRNAGNHENNIFGEDACGGHPEQGGLYHYHSAEFLGNCWNSALVTNSYYNTTDFNGDKARHANGHSKILGVSFDGYPIYGPYGYTTANDANSAVKRIESSYRLRPNGYNPNRPLPSLEPMGAFVQDFEYVQDLGDLDNHNGRFCVTPEYPNGTYAYFMTLDESLDPAYPYAIGQTYYAQPVLYGESLPLNQTVDRVDLQAPFGAIAEPFVGTTPGELSQITGIRMRSFGENYFNNTVTHVRIRGNGGSGAIGIPTKGIVVGVRLTVNSATSKINEGVGYRSTSTEPTIVTLTGGGGTGATAAAQIETYGKISSVRIDNGGRFFVQPPNLRVISGSGTGAKLRPIISAGSIVDVAIDDPGKGYQTIPSIAFTRPAALIRKNRNRSAFNSSANRLTNIARDITSTDTTVYVTSTSGFAQAGEFYINKEKISYSTKTDTTFFGLQRGINFRYDQRIVVDSSQAYNFQVNDIINRSGSTAASKVSRVYDWRPTTRELLVIFEVDELAEIDAGRPLEPTATVRFNGGVQTGCQQFNNAGGCILSYPAQNPGTAHIADPDTNAVDNTGTLYDNQINLDGGAPDTLYGLEAQTQGINTTLFQVNEVITDSEGRQSIVVETGGLSEGVPHEAEVELVLSQASASATFTAGQAINDGIAYGTVKTWDSTTRTLTVEDITTGVFAEGTTISGTTYTIDSVNYTTFLITTTSI